MDFFHRICRVTAFNKVAPFTLRVVFDDGAARIVDFLPVLEGEMYGPLKDGDVFDQVSLDPEAHTLVWPNGADFDPATLYDWPKEGPLLTKLAQTWAVTAR